MFFKFNYGRVFMLLFLAITMAIISAPAAFANSQDNRFGISAMTGELAAPQLINQKQDFILSHTFTINILASGLSDPKLPSQISYANTHKMEKKFQRRWMTVASSFT